MSTASWLSSAAREMKQVEYQRDHERLALQLIPLIAGITPEMHLELHKGKHVVSTALQTFLRISVSAMLGAFALQQPC